MRNKIIRVIISIVVLLIVLSLTSMTVYADTKQYVINTAEFDVELNEDGSADVTETWTVDYQSGEFSRFYKNIYMAVPIDEEYDIEFNFVSVDGKSCDRIYDESDIEDKLFENQNLLKQPVVRNGKTLATVGLNPKIWETWS